MMEPDVGGNVVIFQVVVAVAIHVPLEFRRSELNELTRHKIDGVVVHPIAENNIIVRRVFIIMFRPKGPGKVIGQCHLRNVSGANISPLGRTVKTNDRAPFRVLHPNRTIQPQTSIRVVDRAVSAGSG